MLGLTYRKKHWDLLKCIDGLLQVLLRERPRSLPKEHLKLGCVWVSIAEMGNR